MQLRADVAALQLVLQRTKSDGEAASAQADRRAREQVAGAERQLASVTQRLESLSSTLSALSARAARLAAELGIPAFEVASSGGSDGSFAAALGIATLDGLGPICHDSVSRSERVEVASIPVWGAILASVAAAAARRSTRS